MKPSKFASADFVDTKAGVPQHIAIIPDGNARWSRKNYLNVGHGHKRGVEVIEEVLDHCMEIGVIATTVYAFSTENWNRSEKEKKVLFDLIIDFFTLKIPKIIEKNARIKIIGEIARFPSRVQEVLVEAENASQGNDEYLIQIALNYGGRDEIVRAARKFAEAVQAGKVSPDELNEDIFSSYLDTSMAQNPDLLIRTGGTNRISNFLLYQLSYTEFYFTKTYWPDFTIEELKKAIEAFSKCERRFGGRDC